MAFNTLHLSWGKVSRNDYMLAKKLFFLKVRAKARLNDARCSAAVIHCFNVKLVTP